MSSQEGRRPLCFDWDTSPPHTAPGDCRASPRDELPTPEGLGAKDFVARALSGLPFVAVTTTKPDKYDRYLADVFYQERETDAETVLEKGQVLNRELLSAGLVTEFRKGK